MSADRPPAFADDPGTARYYEQRAAEYDDWYRGDGLFASRDRPGWQAELGRLVGVLESLPERRTLDVACGTAFLSVHLRGPVAGVDQSPSMVALAAVRLRVAAVADALALPIAAGAVERVFTGHFYGHLPPAERGPFLDEARRVGGELVVVDTALRTGVPAEAWEERVLKDGSRHAVYKRFLTPEGLAAEIGGTVLFAGSWFVAARAAWGRPVPERPRRGAARQCTVTSATSASAIDTGTTTAPATL